MKRKDKIIVSFTTWIERDGFVRDMLEHFQNQTMHPDKIILWLSKEEYKTIPHRLSKLKEQGLLDEIKLVSGNTYAHKRWNVFKKHDDSYVILLDDDIYYPEDYVESLYKAAKKYKCPCCYFGRTVDYESGTRNQIEFEHLSPKNDLLSGLSCFPPHSLPKEVLDKKYTNARNQYCTRCDDSWVWAALKKHDISIYNIHEFISYSVDWRVRIIEGTKQSGVWENYNKIKNGGVPQKIKNLCNALKIIGAEKEFNKIYPNFNINTYCDKKMNTEGISICITAYNAKKFIRATLDSVFNQTWYRKHSNWEVLLGIDGCEETLEYVKTIQPYYGDKLRVFMMDKNVGTYVTSNTIMKQAYYDTLFRFDSDDLMNENCIETVMNNMSDCDMLRFNMQNFGLKTNIQQAWGQHAIKRSVFDKFGGYQPWPCAADAEMTKRLGKFINIKLIPDVLFMRRMHRESLTCKPGELQLYGGKEGSVREKYKKIVTDMHINKESEAIINCVTSDFVEIFPKKKNQHINESISSDKVVYTYLAEGGILYEPSYRMPGFDYICFTDQEVTSTFWKILPIPQSMHMFAKTKQEKIIQAYPYEVLPDCKLSIWVSNNEESMIKLSELIFDQIPNKSVYAFVKHNNTLYKEADRCIRHKLDSTFNIKSQIFKYQREGYINNQGLVMTNVIIRLHDEMYCHELSEKWRDELLKTTNIEQLSFNYCLWKLGTKGFQELNK